MPTVRRSRKKQKAEKESAKDKIRRSQRQMSYKFTCRLMPQERLWLDKEAELRKTTIAEVLRILIVRHLRCGLLENLAIPERGHITKVAPSPYPIKINHRAALRLKILSHRRGVSMNQAVRMLCAIIGMGNHIEVIATSSGKTRVKVNNFSQPRTSQDVLLDKEITEILNGYRRLAGEQSTTLYIEMIEEKHGKGLGPILKSIHGEVPQGNEED